MLKTTSVRLCLFLSEVKDFINILQCTKWDLVKMTPINIVSSYLFVSKTECIQAYHSFSSKSILFLMSLFKYVKNISYYPARNELMLKKLNDHTFMTRSSLVKVAIIRAVPTQKTSTI